MSALGLAFGLAGCAVTAVDGTRMRLNSSEFSDYVEAAFRRQNEVASALALALDDADPDSPRFAELDEAELALLNACLGLNELAANRRDGDNIGNFSALRRARQTPDCERATSAAAALL
jgi:hypothetical protein